MREFAEEIAGMFGKTLEEVMSNRKGDNTLPKYLISYCLRYRGASTTQIGRLIKRDHTTIMYNTRKVKENPKFLAIAENILRDRESYDEDLCWYDKKPNFELKRVYNYKTKRAETVLVEKAGRC